MKPEDIKRIAEIIGLETWQHKKAEMRTGECWVVVGGKTLGFKPHTNWAHTGMLLEWLYSKYVVAHGMMEDGGCYCVLRSEDTLATGEGETLQLAICNAVLSVGEEVE